MMYRHRRIPEKPGTCQGSGMDPKPGTVKQEWPIRKAIPRFLSKSVRAFSGGAAESHRSRPRLRLCLSSVFPLKDLDRRCQSEYQNMTLLSGPGCTGAREL
jgi:hypothetical protein